MDLFARIAQLRDARKPVVLVTVVSTRGSTPRKSGARMLVHPDGTTEGSIGGGSVEHSVRQHAARVLSRGVPELVDYQLTTQLGMCCGGQMQLFVEPIVSNPPLLVFGCGHVGSAIINAASKLGFEVIAIDDLPENTADGVLPANTRVVGSFEPAELETLPFGDDTYVVICTREHALDQKVLELCAKKTTRYLGAIGSQRKAEMQRQRMAAKDFSPEDIARVRCPMGLDIGAQTPDEIAVSICAELIAVRRKNAS